MNQLVACCTCGSVINITQYICCNIQCLRYADMRDDDDRSPLDLACVRRHESVVEYLVEKANCDVSE